MGALRGALFISRRQARPSSFGVGGRCWRGAWRGAAVLRQALALAAAPAAWEWQIPRREAAAAQARRTTSDPAMLYDSFTAG